MFRRILALAATAAVALTAALAQAPSSRPVGRMIVKFRQIPDCQAVDEIAGQCGGRLVAVDGKTALLTGRAADIARSFYGSAIEYVEPEVTMHSMGTPNDPLFSKQWGLGAAGIRIAAAHDITKGEGQTVAIVDTGLRPGSDLAGTKIAAGTDIINNDNDPTDDNGHGTHVAGTIAQTTNNGLGCAGVAPGSTLLPVKVLGADGSGSNYGVALGIRWAADHGANVVNLSLGGGPSQTLKEAVQYAVKKGVVVVAASGNGGGSSLSYPAAYPEVISVGAVGKKGTRASFSQYGPGLTLVAPGVGIIQQTFNPANGRYSFSSWSGTSMAAPHVSGVVALLRSKETLSPDQVKERLTSTARDLGPPGRDNQTGAGTVDAPAALNAAGTSPPPTPIPAPLPSNEAQQVLDLVNAERVKVGALPLIFHDMLGRAAQKHSDDMAARKFFAHINPDGLGPEQRIAAEGYAARTWGENIAAGYATPERVMAAWMESAGHKANILNASFREIGIGITRSAGSPYGIYWVEDFGAR